MNRRMAVVLLTLAGLFVATYLYLYKIGVIGTLVCGTGGCETVQLSPQSRFLGVEVALIGIAGYAALLVLSLLATRARFHGRSWPALGVVAGSGIGVLFTLYLTYLELFVIHAICRWCVASAVIIGLVFVVGWLDYRRAGTIGS